MTRVALIGAITIALGLAPARPAAAQTAPGRPAVTTSRIGGESQGDLDIGANFMRVRDNGVTEPFNQGLHAGVSYRISHSLSVLGEVSADYHKLPDYTKHIYAYGGGVRVNTPRQHARIDPLVQVMLGWAQDNGIGDGHHNYYPFVAPAAGVDLGLASGVAARVRVDFPLWMTFGDIYKGSRVSVGLSCRFGTRKITT